LHPTASTIAFKKVGVLTSWATMDWEKVSMTEELLTTRMQQLDLSQNIVKGGEPLGWYSITEVLVLPMQCLSHICPLFNAFIALMGYLRGLETGYHDTHRAIGLDSSGAVTIVPNGGSQHRAFMQWIPHRQLLTWLHRQTFITRRRYIGGPAPAAFIVEAAPSDYCNPQKVYRRSSAGSFYCGGCTIRLL
jgi:hypothetical protein